MKSLHNDGIPREELIASVALTEIPSVSPFSLSEWRPGETRVFTFTNPLHRRWVADWLSRATTLVGMNIQFDLLYLRAHPATRPPLISNEHLLIDLSVVAYLHSELRPERGLKALGPILGTHRYDRTLADDRFPSPSSPDLHRYNAEDTHNTVLAIAELARRIRADFPSSPKLSPECLRFYSDTIHTCIEMSENGIPMHRPSLTLLHHTLARRMEAASATASSYNLLLSGPGSDLSKREFLEQALSSANLTDHPLVEYTEKQRKVCVNDSNRNLVKAHLPPTSPLHPALEAFDTFTYSSKLRGSFTQPLLYHRANRPLDQSSRLLPCAPTRFVETAHPTWFPVPSFSKDSAGDSGGTQQGRITCKAPAAQTFPPPVKKCIRSRHRNGRILHFDLSQIELRVAALLSGEPSMLTIYANNGDIHTDMAVRLFGPAILSNPHFGSSDGRVDPRQWAKQCNFLALYRGGWRRLQDTVRELCGVLLPDSQCFEIIDSLPRARPRLFEWHDELMAIVRKTGRLELPFFGQSRWLMGSTKKGLPLNEIANFPVQTWAGNIMLAVQHSLRHHLRPGFHVFLPDGARMFLNTYDSVMIDCPSHRAALSIQGLVLPEVIHDVSTSGLWARLESHTGHTCPLRYSSEILP